MGFLVPVVAGLAAAAGTKMAASALSGGKPKAMTPVPAVTRNIAAERAAISDSLARRTGQRANRRTRYGGAEATTGTTTSLLGRTGS